MSDITLIEKSKTGEEFLKQIALGVKAGMRLRVRDYRNLLSANRTDEAIEMLKVAINNPSFFRSQKDIFISKYGRNYLVECISAYNVSTIADADTLLTGIEIEMDTLVDYTISLVSQYQDGILTYEQIADRIETDIEYVVNKWQFPLDTTTAIW